MSKTRRQAARRDEADDLTVHVTNTVSSEEHVPQAAARARVVHHLSQRLHHRTHTMPTAVMGEGAAEAGTRSEENTKAATLASRTSAVEHTMTTTQNNNNNNNNATMEPSQAAALPCADISLYLQNAIREVVEQMRSPHSAHDTARHVLLTDELLHGDAAWGFTPTMVLAGVDAMLELFTEAFLQGKQLTHIPHDTLHEPQSYRETMNGTSSSRHASPSRPALMTNTLTRTMWSAFLTQAQAPAHAQAAGAVPVEGFLPPLIPHVQRIDPSGVEVTAMEIYKAFCAAQETNEWAAMSVTTGSPVLTHGALPQSYTHPSQGQTATGAVAADDGEDVREERSGPRSLRQPPASEHVPSLHTVPEALHALIVHCGRPLSCLTLQDQQCMPLALQTLCAALARLVTRMQSVRAEEEQEMVGMAGQGGSDGVRRGTTPKAPTHDVPVISVAATESGTARENHHKATTTAAAAQDTPRLSATHNVEPVTMLATPQSLQATHTVPSAERAAMAQAIRVAALQTISNLLYGCCGASGEEEAEEHEDAKATRGNKPKRATTTVKNKALCDATTQAVDFTTSSSSSSASSSASSAMPGSDFISHLSEHWDALLRQPHKRKEAEAQDEVIVVHMKDSPETDSDDDEDEDEHTKRDADAHGVSAVHTGTETELWLVLTIFDQLCGLARRKRAMECDGLADTSHQQQQAGKGQYVHNSKEEAMESVVQTTGERLRRVLVQLVPTRALRCLVQSHGPTGDEAAEEKEHTKLQQRTSQRVASLCVDLMWHVMRLDERGTARRVLYDQQQQQQQQQSSPTHEGAAAAAVTKSSTSEGLQTAMADAFEALVQQLNGSYMAWHREVRNDLVLWLTLVLRHGSLAHEYNEKDDEGGEEEGDEAGVSCDVLPRETIDAVNAIALVLFDLVCGAELDDLANIAPPHTNTGNCTAVHEVEYGEVGRATHTPASVADTTEPAAAQPGTLEERTYDKADGGVRALLARRAVRQYALRYFTLASPAVRKDNLQFKIAAWQLLEAFCEWQAATITATALLLHRHAPPEEGDDDVTSANTASVGMNDVLEALGVVDLLSLGLMDVWIMYVDTLCPCAHVVSWTRDELLSLEAEAWELMTNLMECHHSLLARTRTRTPGTMPGATPSVPPAGLTRYADAHFLQAGGLGVLLRYLHDAPMNVEPLKRMAMTLLTTLTRLALLDVQTSSNTMAEHEQQQQQHEKSRTRDVVLDTLMQNSAEMVALLLDMLQPHEYDLTLTGNSHNNTNTNNSKEEERRKRGVARQAHSPPSLCTPAQVKATQQLTRAAQQRDAIAAAEAARSAHEAASRLRGSYPTGTLVTQCVHILDQLVCLAQHEAREENVGGLFVQLGGLQTMLTWWNELLETLRQAAQAGPETLRHDLHDMSSLFLALLALLRHITMPPHTSASVKAIEEAEYGVQAMQAFVQQGGMATLLDLVEVLLPVTLPATRHDDGEYSSSSSNHQSSLMSSHAMAAVRSSQAYSSGMARNARTSTMDQDLRDIARDLLGQLLTVLADMLHDDTGGNRNEEEEDRYGSTMNDTVHTTVQQQHMQSHKVSAVLCKTAFLQWRSTRYVDESHTIALNAVQLLLLLWQAYTSAAHVHTPEVNNNSSTTSATDAVQSNAMISSNNNMEHELGLYCAAYMRLHEAIQCKVPLLLREDYVRRLLQRKAALQQPVTEFVLLRRYYEHAYGKLGSSASPDQTRPSEKEGEDSVREAEVQTVRRAMSELLAISDRESHSRQLCKLQARLQLCFDVLGLKVYSCLAALGFDTLCEGSREYTRDEQQEQQQQQHASPLLLLNASGSALQSKGDASYTAKENANVRVEGAVVEALALSAGARAQLMLVAALPMLCVEEIHMAVAQTVGVSGRADMTHTPPEPRPLVQTSEREKDEGDVEKKEEDKEKEEDVQVAMRPCTPDVYYLRERCVEAESRGTQLVQLAALHAQLHETQVQTDYERFLVSRLRQPIGEERRNMNATVTAANHEMRTTWQGTQKADSTAYHSNHHTTTLVTSTHVDRGHSPGNATPALMHTSYTSTIGTGDGLPEPNELAASLVQRCVRRQQQYEDTLLQRTLPRGLASYNTSQPQHQQYGRSTQEAAQSSEETHKAASVRLAQSVALPPRPLLASSLPLPSRTAHMTGTTSASPVQAGTLGEVVEGMCGSQRMQDALLFTTKPPVRPPRPLMALRAKKLNMLRHSLKALPPLEMPSDAAK